MTKPNIILITVDCLRAEYIEKMKKTSSLFRDGIMFKNTFAVAPWTPPSFKAMFQSIYPSMMGGYMKLSSKIPTFVEILKQNGYHTVGISQTPWLSRFFGYNRGFNEFNDFDLYNSAYLRLVKKIYYGLINNHPKLWALYYLSSRYLFKHEDRKVNDLVRRHLDLYTRQHREKPLFLWVHYMGVHDPSIPSREYLTGVSMRTLLNLLEKYKQYVNSGKIEIQEFFVTEDLEKFRELYEKSIMEVDDTLSELFEILNTYISLDDTYIFLTADHGQEFGEHGMFTHGVHLYDELLRVPLMIRGNIEKGEHIRSQLISLLDLAPTILKISNSKIPVLYQGKSFHEAITKTDIGHRTYVISEEGKDTIVIPFVNYKFENVKIAIRTKNWKYIWYPVTNQEELYHIPTDQEEKRNLTILDGLFEDILTGFRDIKNKHLHKISRVNQLAGVRGY